MNPGDLLASFQSTGCPVSAVSADFPQRFATEKSIAPLIDEILQDKLAEIGLVEPRKESA